MFGINKNNDLWDKAITDVKVLAYEDNKSIQHFLVYSLPWPFKNRDFVTETTITTDSYQACAFIVQDLYPIKFQKNQTLSV
jgi:hypothetical protein